MAKKKRKTTGKNAVTLSLTSQAIDRLAEMAQKSGFSRSAFVENLMAGTVSITAPEAEKNLLVSVENEAEDTAKVQVDLAETTAANTKPTAPDPDAELAEKVASQAKIIADLEAKLAEASPPLKRPVARPNTAEKSAPAVTDQSPKIATLEKQIADQKNQIQDLTKQLNESAKNLGATNEKIKHYNKNLTKSRPSLKQFKGKTKPLFKPLNLREQRLLNSSNRG
ncbi:hypothetical protein [Picosynechococcus sp. NKBG042902]|uniref:hypothetical protein n=1 Tax=Picosynechococcus sp. NKBG042902 TaxID=490193 RepID=UPI0004AAA7DC|nr:hypothetical protein [Picosynechococcus sp. NKBG042902]